MSGTLPSWIERLLGISAAAGEGTVWSFELSWPWPPWVTLLFVVFAVVFVVTIYLREGRRVSTPYRMALAAVRLSLVAMLALMIAQVALSLQRTGLPYVAVLLDDSLSMTIADRYEQKLGKELSDRVKQALADDAQPTRWNLVRTLLLEHDAAMLAAVADDYKLRVCLLTGNEPCTQPGVVELAEQLRSVQPTGRSTRLGDGVRAVLDDLRGTAPAAVILLSDGINTDGPPLSEAAALARRRDVPLFVVAIGSGKPVRDLKLTDLLVDDVVFVDDVVQFECRVSATGLRGKKARVVLRRQDNPQVLASLEVTLDADGRSKLVRLPYRPAEVGKFRYVVEVEPQQGELNTRNNRKQRTVEVRKETIRVLLLQAYPSFEFRYLENMLRRDETIELNTVLQDAEVEYAEQDASALRVFPVRRDELFSYDVIILGDANPALLSPSNLQDLADFVDQPGKGGAIVLIAGPEFMPAAFRDTPLARLMPINFSSLRYPDTAQVLTDGFCVQPTELGLASPPMQLGDTPAETRKIWANLPPLYWLLEAPDLKPAARVLAVDPKRLGHDGRPLPVICLQYVGAGKVLFHATDETWRWRRRVGDVFFARYWIQMIRYLGRSKLSAAERSATLSVDKREYAQGEPVRLRVRFADERLAPAEDDGVTVVLEHEHHKTRRIQLRRATSTRGVFESLLGRPAPGSYHAWIAIPATEGRARGVDFTVHAPAGEFERVRADTSALRRAAKVTNGRYYTPRTAHRLLKDLPPGRQVPIESLPLKPIWNKWPVLLLVLMLLTIEWVLRKLGGMV